MDPIAENLLVKLVLKSLNEADVAALFAETNAVRQALIVKRALELSFDEAHLVARALILTR